MKKLVVSLLNNVSEGMVGSVTAQSRFKHSIESLGVDCIITDLDNLDEHVGSRTIDYLMINEPPIDLQDKHEWWQNNYFERLEAVAANRIGLQLHGEHAVIIYHGSYDNYWKRMISICDDIFQITPDLCAVSEQAIREATGKSITVEYLPSTGINNVAPVYDKDPEVADNYPLCYASRVAPRKKPNNFIRLMAHIYPDDPKFRMYGDIAPGIHNVALENEMAELSYPRDAYYRGEFSPEYLGDHRYRNPSSDHKIVWGGAQIGKGNQCLMSPRIELAVLEAYQFCTIPILFNETVPEWMPKDTYIGINWLDINNVRKVEQFTDTAEFLRSELERVSNLTPAEVIGLCQKALTAVMENNGVRPKLINFINEYVSTPVQEEVEI